MSLLADPAVGLLSRLAAVRLGPGTPVYEVTCFVDSMKVCCRCHTPKPLSEFTKSKARKDGYNPSCKVCHRAYVKQHYDENKPYYKNKARARTRQIREWLDDRKRQPCADCKQTFNPWQMDFDHKFDKKFDLGQACVLGLSFERIQDEVAKCDVVCANCHRQRTHERRVTTSPSSTMERATRYERGG